MIARVHLKNWKSYADGTLEIDPLTVLIGTNSSGKSNAVDALVFLNRIAMGSSLTTALTGDAIQTPLRGGIEWAARKPEETFTLGVIFEVDDGQTDYEYRIQCRIADKRCEIEAETLTRNRYKWLKGVSVKRKIGNIKLFRTDPCLEDSPTIVARLYNEKQGSPRPMGRSQPVLFQLAGQKSRQEIQDGVSVVANALRDIFILDPIPSHMRSYSPLSEKLESDASNIAGVIAALSEDRKKDIEATLTRYVTRLPERDVRHIYAEPVGRFQSDAMLYSEETWNGTDTAVVDSRGMSDGTLRFLATLTALLTRPEKSLLVLEEVDNGLHPSRAKLLLNMLREVGDDRKIDVIVTTHNPALLDAMSTELVSYISVAYRDNSTGASCLTPLDSLDHLPKLLAQGQVGKLSSQGLIERSLRDTSRRSPQLELKIG